MKQTGWKSPYAKSPALPKQRADTHKGHQVKTAKVVTDRQKKRG